MSDRPTLDDVLNSMAQATEPKRGIEALQAAAQAELKAHPTPGRWWREAALFSGLNVVLTAGLLAMLQWSAGQNPNVMLVCIAAVSLALALGVGLIVAVRPGAGRGALGLLALCGAVALCMLLGASGTESTGPLMAGTGCARFELTVSLVPMLGALWVLRRFAFNAARAAIAGASVGAVGLLSLHMHCPVGTVSHLALFHLLPWALVIAATLLVRRLMPTWSHAP